MSGQASRPGHFTSEERTIDTNWIGGWMDHLTDVNDMEKYKFLKPPRLELRAVGSRYTDWAIPALLSSSKRENCLPLSLKSLWLGA
jgi:hypothetical protein